MALDLLRGNEPGHIGEGEIDPLQHCLDAMLRQEDVVGPMRNNGPQGTVYDLWEPQRNVGAQWLMTVERNAG